MSRFYFFLVLGMFCFFSSANAQIEEKEEGAGRYSHQRYGGLVIKTNGWGGSYVRGKNKGAFKVRQISYDFSFVKHEKEQKSYFQDPSAKPFVFGKQNAMYSFKLNYGFKKDIALKERSSGVQVSYAWGIGPAVSLLRPIYLEVLIIDPNLNGYTLSTEKYNPNKHFADNIYGRASNFLGISEIALLPGFSAKGSMLFEYSNYRDGIKGFEVGMAAEAYPKRIEIMSNQVLSAYPDGAKNHWLFVSGYVHFYIGRKYN
jgi:hypothetical protein